MIYDCFIFDNELDLLEIRLNTLADVVDCFVLVEAETTHQGAPKPLHYLENKDRFAQFNIIHHVADIKDCPCPYTREFAQRRSIKDALSEASGDDYILVTDVDEIPKPYAVLEASGRKGRTSLWMQMYYFYLNTPVIGFKDWFQPQGVPFGELTDPQDLRNHEYQSKIENAGWHFSFCGNAENAVRKVQSYSHNDYNRPGICDTEVMQKRIDNLSDPLDRLFRMNRVDIDDTFPPYLRENQEKFRHLIRE
jgi:hypothetical protein